MNCLPISDLHTGMQGGVFSMSIIKTGTNYSIQKERKTAPLVNSKKNSFKGTYGMSANQ